MYRIFAERLRLNFFGNVTLYRFWPYTAASMHLLHQCNLALLHFGIDEKAIHIEEIGKINILHPIKTGIKKASWFLDIFSFSKEKYCMNFPPKIVFLVR